MANWAYAGRPSGLARGFAHYDDRRMGATAILASTWLTRRPWDFIRARFGDQSQGHRKRAEHVNAEFLKWLRGHDGRPFFAFLNYFDAHGPYELHEPYVSFRDPPPRYKLFELDGGPRTSDAPELLDAYESAISHLDHEVGVLLDALDADGHLDNTIIVVTSDHGELFGEHDVMRHGNSVYRPVLHVPLLVIYPGRVPAGMRVQTATSIRDIPTTVLELAGYQPNALPGRSLSRFWSGDPVAGDLAFSHLSFTPWYRATDPVSKGRMISIFSDSLHYILRGDGVEKLYNFVRDPDELIDLAAVPTPPNPAVLPFRAQALAQPDKAPDWEIAPEPVTPGGGG